MYALLWFEYIGPHTGRFCPCPKAAQYITTWLLIQKYIGKASAQNTAGTFRRPRIYILGYRNVPAASGFERMLGKHILRPIPFHGQPGYIAYTLSERKNGSGDDLKPPPELKRYFYTFRRRAGKGYLPSSTANGALAILAMAGSGPFRMAGRLYRATFFKNDNEGA